VRALENKLRIWVYSVCIGALLALFAGWIGAIFFPELLIVFLFGLIPVFFAKPMAALTWLLLPAGFGLMAGSWILTVLVLPVLAVALRFRPWTFALLCPIVGTAVGWFVIWADLVQVMFGNLHIQLPSHSATSGQAALRMQWAGGFAGFVTSVFFARSVANFMR
jgi:hypothetical protein